MDVEIISWMPPNRSVALTLMMYIPKVVYSVCVKENGFGSIRSNMYFLFAISMVIIGVRKRIK